MKRAIAIALGVIMVASGATVVISQPSSCPCSFVDPEDVVSFLVPDDIGATASFCDRVESAASGCRCVQVEGTAGFCELQPSTTWVGIGEQGSSQCEQQTIMVPVCPSTEPAPAPVTTTCGMPSADANSEWRVGCFAPNDEFDGGSVIEDVEIVLETEQRCSHSGAGFPGDEYSLVCTSEFQLELSDGNNNVRRIAVDSAEPLFTPDIAGLFPPLEYTSTVPSNPQGPEVMTPVSWSEYRKNPPVTVTLTAAGLEMMRGMKASGGEVGLAVVGTSTVQVLNERIETFTQTAQPGMDTKVTFSTAEPNPSSRTVICDMDHPIQIGGAPINRSCSIPATEFPAGAIFTGLSMRIKQWDNFTFTATGSPGTEYNVWYQTDNRIIPDGTFEAWPSTTRKETTGVIPESGEVYIFDGSDMAPVTISGTPAGLQYAQALFDANQDPVFTIGQGQHTLHTIQNGLWHPVFSHVIVELTIKF